MARCGIAVNQWGPVTPLLGNKAHGNKAHGNKAHGMGQEGNVQAISNAQFLGEVLSFSGVPEKTQRFDDETRN